MRKSLVGLLLIVAVLIFTGVNTPPERGLSEGIDFFEGTWEEVKAESKETGKPIFVDAYAVWCGPCKWMSSTVFTDGDVAAYYNEHFINYKFDMEKGEGPTFRSTYRVMAYPTLFYLNETGGVLKKVVGALNPSAFLETGKSVIESAN
jgi:thiol:disulfide interchange protein